jgi:hypothetical protein
VPNQSSNQTTGLVDTAARTIHVAQEQLQSGNARAEFAQGEVNPTLKIRLKFNADGFAALMNLNPH